ncbi:hypothetical protein [Jannaschia sp. R86511]|uniref:hypothetical protein n=1 Tax=Jannaschia sp. R86511 TaxID=3093853 RepID=UPI0036D23CAA
MRPPDDPDKTPFHFGYRLIVLWFFPLVALGTPFLLWAIYQDIAAGEDVRARSYGMFLIYPLFLVAWLFELRRFVRARRRGETPKPHSFRPTPVDDE